MLLTFGNFLATKRNKLEAVSLHELHGGHCPVCVVVRLGYLRQTYTPLD